MSDLTETVARLRDLLAASEELTPSPLTTRRVTSEYGLENRIDDAAGEFVAYVMADEDAALIVALRNDADRLLEAAAAVERVLALADRWERRAACIPNTDRIEEIVGCAAEVREALAAADPTLAEEGEAQP